MDSIETVVGKAVVMKAKEASTTEFMSLLYNLHRPLSMLFA